MKINTRGTLSTPVVLMALYMTVCMFLAYPLIWFVGLDVRIRVAKHGSAAEHGFTSEA